MKHRITYFPMEQKFSIWSEDHKLIKEWFNSREEAQRWLTKEITKHQELNDFAALLLSEGYEIIYPNNPSAYFHFFKNGGMGYVQFERLGGVSFTSEHKPCKEAGTGYSTGRHLEPQFLTLENAKKAVSNLTWNEHKRVIKFWASSEEFMNSPMNKGRYQILTPTTK